MWGVRVRLGKLWVEKTSLYIKMNKKEFGKLMEDLNSVFENCKKFTNSQRMEIKSLILKKIYGKR
jgi:hypothetical protein